jgi:hypothetical protein
MDVTSDNYKMNYKHMKKMKPIALIIVVSLWIPLTYAQEESTVNKETSQKLTKEQRQERRKAELEASASLVADMIESRKFVLEADYLLTQHGQRISVSSILNFIIVDSSRFTLQLASDNYFGGPNGLGGVTTEGNISKFVIEKTGKNKNNYRIRLFSVTHIGTFDIVFNISPDANADAQVSSITGGRIIYGGRLVPVQSSRVYKAMSL